MATDRQIHYRDIQKYKYRLDREYRVEIAIRPSNDINTTFIDLFSDGQLVIKQDYGWDGPSGPTIDSDTFMRGALVHDSLHQLLREGVFGVPGSTTWESARKAADMEMRRLCKEDGMGYLRRFYTYNAVRKFAASAAKPGDGVAPDDTRKAVGSPKSVPIQVT